MYDYLYEKLIVSRIRKQGLTKIIKNIRSRIILVNNIRINRAGVKARWSIYSYTAAGISFSRKRINKDYTLLQLNNSRVLDKYLLQKRKFIPK